MIPTEAGGKSAVFKRVIEMKVDARAVMPHPFAAVVNMRRIRVAGTIAEMARRMLRRMRRRFRMSLRRMRLRMFVAVGLLPRFRSTGRNILPPAAHLSTAPVLLAPLGCQRSYHDQNCG